MALTHNPNPVTKHHVRCEKVGHEPQSPAATDQTRVSNDQASSPVPVGASDKQTPTAKFKAWIDNAIHQHGDDPDQLDDQTLIEIMTRSAKLYRRVKRDRARPSDDEDDPACKRKKILTDDITAEPTSRPLQKIGFNAQGEAELVDCSSGDDDGDAGDDDDEYEDEDDDGNSLERPDTENVIQSEDTSENDEDQGDPTKDGNDASDDISYDAQKCPHRFHAHVSPKAAQLDRKCATPTWMLRNGHERSLLIRFHPLEDSWGTAQFEEQFRKLTTSDVIKAMSKPGCILEGDGEDGQPLSMLEISKGRWHFLSMWASPQHAVLAAGTRTPLEGLGHLKLKQLHFSDYTDAIIDNARDLPEFCVREALIYAFGRRKFTLGHRFHGKDDTGHYWIRFPDTHQLPCRIPIDRCASRSEDTHEAVLVLKPVQWDICDVCGREMEGDHRCRGSLVQPIRHRYLCSTLKIPSLRREVEHSDKEMARKMQTRA
jgi:hypothetical protein